VTAGLARRVGRLERAVAPVPSGPAFTMAPDADTAERGIERLPAEHGGRPPRALFVMTCPGVGERDQ
jgi:hypothetical protein